MQTGSLQQKVPAVPNGMKKAQEKAAGSMSSSPGAPGHQVVMPDEKKEPTLKKPKKKLPIKTIIGGVVLVLLLTGVGAGFFLSQSNQDTRNQAATFSVNEVGDLDRIDNLGIGQASQLLSQLINESGLLTTGDSTLDKMIFDKKPFIQIYSYLNSNYLPQSVAQYKFKFAAVGDGAPTPGSVNIANIYNGYVIWSQILLDDAIYLNFNKTYIMMLFPDLKEFGGEMNEQELISRGIVIGRFVAVNDNVQRRLQAVAFVDIADIEAVINDYFIGVVVIDNDPDNLNPKILTTSEKIQ